MRKLAVAVSLILLVGGLAVRPAAADPIAASYCGTRISGWALSWADTTDPENLTNHGWLVFSTNHEPRIYIARGFLKAIDQGVATKIRERWYPGSEPGNSPWYTRFNGDDRPTLVGSWPDGVPHVDRFRYRGVC